MRATKTKSRFNKAHIIYIFILVLLLGAASFFGLKYYQNSKSVDVTTQKEAEALISKVGELMILPQDEMPTIATVADKEKLSNQEFFANAQNGDKVLIYSKARKAILYSVSMNKIIEVAPLNASTQ